MSAPSRWEARATALGATFLIRRSPGQWRGCAVSSRSPDRNGTAASLSRAFLGHARGPERYSSRASRQLVEQRFRLLQVRCVETLSEPVVDGGKQITSFSAATLV